MIDALVVAVRILQYLAATFLFGTPLFLLYAVRGPAGRWPRPLFAVCAGLLMLAAPLSLAVQTAAMAGDPAAALDPGALADVLTGSALGAAILVRFAVAAAALVGALIAPPGPRCWAALSALGGLALASLAWGGHGAADEGLGGSIHTAADILHLLAVGAWVGALAGLAILLARHRASETAEARALHGALAAFSGVGTAVVALVAATGLLNAWFLVGPSRLGQIGASPYGRLLLLKLAVFAGMLSLAAVNRYRLTPALANPRGPDGLRRAIRALRLSIALESAAAVVVLALVGFLGELAPVAAQ